MATIRNRHNYKWFSGLHICELNRSLKLVSRSRQIALMCILYEYYIGGVSYILINRRLWLYGFTRCVSFNVPDPGTIWDGTVHALRLRCVPPCLLFILDRQRKLTVIHKYIVPHTPLFRCTVHNFGRLICVSPQWNRPQYEHVTTPWRYH